MEYITRHLGRDIKRLRLARGLTADALARSVGITENAIRKLEAGDSKEPRFSTGLRIASTLRVDPGKLVRGRPVATAIRPGPELASAIQRIRENRGRLKQRGVAHVSIFGSVARGDATASSDIDIIVKPAEPRPFTLIDLGFVSDILRDILGAKVDVLTYESVRQSRFAQRAQEEAVIAF
jgi:predicted nucleotidyltransferase/DNA-binding Xre family transcriptional regulator